MKTYEFMVGATERRYGTTHVEADTLEEAKQKFFDEKLHLNTELKDGGEFEHYNIVTAFEINTTTGQPVEDGEEDSQIDIPGEKSEFRRGLEMGRQDAREAEKRTQMLARQLRDMQSEVYKAKLIGHVARTALNKARNSAAIGEHTRHEINEAIALINGKTTDHDALRIMVDVSMVHMDPKTNDFFLSKSTELWPIFGTRIEGGYIFFCQEDPVDDLPADLEHVLQWARNIHGAEYVKFDSDGFEHDGLLPKFNWS